MSYYTEGYVSKIELECVEIADGLKTCPFAHFWSPQVMAIGIEPTQSFKIEGRKDVALLVDSGSSGAKENEVIANNPEDNVNVKDKDYGERFPDRGADITNKESYLYDLNKKFFVNVDA